MAIQTTLPVDPDNRHFSMAFDFVSQTDCSIYLTGKAGTGKTTFLKYLKANCRKNMVVVAPTGVAAINAGGVTLHSFFQLPFGPYIPEVKTGFGLNEGIVDKHALFKNIRLHGSKRKLIRELELLVIDEVSMLRSDTLDAMDAVLKVFRKNSLPFGGVQVLFIGDLYQLPPVVKDTEKALLQPYYPSPFFFDARVLNQVSLVYIELKKMYRQNEQFFIDLLNKVRQNTLSDEDYSLLNQQYRESVSDRQHYITLTTHNQRAELINQAELKKLPAALHSFQGQIKGDFSERQLPVDMNLHVKEGAQVMFVKNDSSIEKRYYNGKIATITRIADGDIFVQFPENDEEFQVDKETWDNISYSLDNETNQIKEKIDGQFIQYPLRLAWAITIHKSQGLTFERAIIDAGYSFAPGQVYVALSRCTSLQGIILQSRITPAAIYTEERIRYFSGQETPEDVLNGILQQQRFAYQTKSLIQLFSLHEIRDAFYQVEEATLQCNHLPDEEKAFAETAGWTKKAVELYRIADKYRQQLATILQGYQPGMDMQIFENRIRDGIQYFSYTLQNDLIKPLFSFMKSIEANSKLKKYILVLATTYNTCWQFIDRLQQSTLNNIELIDAEQRISKPTLQLTKPKMAKGSSPKETLVYFAGGKSIEEVAAIRNLALSTIEKHLLQFIKSGELEIERFLSAEQVTEIRDAYLKLSTQSATNTTALKEYLQHTFTYFDLQAALHYLNHTGSITYPAQ
jgi:hypothetical protein